MHSRHLSTKLQDKINKLHCKIFTKKIKTIQSWHLMHLPKIYKRLRSAIAFKKPRDIQALTVSLYPLVTRNSWMCKGIFMSNVSRLTDWNFHNWRRLMVQIVHIRCRDSLMSSSRSHPMWSSIASSQRGLTWPFRLSRDASPYESSPHDISERCPHIWNVWKIHTDRERRKPH